MTAATTKLLDAPKRIGKSAMKWLLRLPSQFFYMCLHMYPCVCQHVFVKQKCHNWVNHTELLLFFFKHTTFICHKGTSCLFASSGYSSFAIHSRIYVMTSTDCLLWRMKITIQDIWKLQIMECFADAAKYWRQLCKLQKTTVIWLRRFNSSNWNESSPINEDWTTIRRFLMLIANSSQ